MSVWKKASKVNQRTHQERHQPESRKHLGLLEKHKDYVKRAQDQQDKKATLKLLSKRALNRNPDEFYHHMINAKVKDGIHHEKETESEDTPEQIQLMVTQDLKYISTKRVQEMRKIERMQSSLQLISVDHGMKNKHIRFSSETRRSEERFEDLADESKEKLKAKYKELGKRIQREHSLAVLQDKLEIKRHLALKKNLLPPTRVRKGNKNSAPVYKWQYERKK